MVELLFRNGRRLFDSLKMIKERIFLEVGKCLMRGREVGKSRVKRQFHTAQQNHLQPHGGRSLTEALYKDCVVKMRRMMKKKETKKEEEKKKGIDRLVKVNTCVCH